MRKKLFAILMSAMMMVTFMPSMAFATVLDENGIASEVLDATVSAGALHEECEKQYPSTISTEVVYKESCYGKDFGTGKITKIVKKTCGICGETWLDTTSADAHSTVTETMNAKQVKALINTYAPTLVEEFVAAVEDTVIHGTPLIRNASTPQEKKNMATKFAQKMISVLAGLQPGEKQALDMLKVELTEEFDEAATLITNLKNADTSANVAVAFEKIMKDIYGDIIESVLGYVDAVTYTYKTGTAKTTSDVCGYAVEYCKNCKEIYSINVLKHQGSRAAACATHYTCTVCGKEIYVGEPTAASAYKTDLMAIASNASLAVKAAKDENKQNTIEAVRAVENLILNLDSSKNHKVKVEVKNTDCGDVYSFTCENCGEQVYPNIPVVKTLTGHKLETVTLVKPSCKALSAVGDKNFGFGLTVERCADCGVIDVTSFNLVEPKHTYEEVVVPATCSLPGCTVQVCKDCGKVKPLTADNFTAPKGHTYNNLVIKPTCTSPGLQVISCADCGQVYYNYNKDAKVEDAKMIAHLGDLNSIRNVAELLGTQYVGIIDNNHGKTPALGNVTATYYFTGLGVMGLPDLMSKDKAIKLIDTSTKAKHTFNTWEKISDATCESGEVWAPKCSVCGYLDKHNVTGKQLKVGTALGHKVKTVVVAPTCNTGGYSYNVCETCGAYLFKDAAGDYYMNYVLGTPKEDSYVMSPKNTTIASADAAKNGKTFKFAKTSPVVGPEATCDFSGDFKVIKEATFHEVGCEAHVCTVCGAVGHNRHEIPKLTLGKAYQPKLTAGKGKITVKITKANKYATGYQIVYKVTGKNNAKYVKVTGKTPSKVIKSLKKGKKYEVKVRPYRVDGGKTFYGKYSSVKYVTVK